MKKGDLGLGNPLKFYNGGITLRFSQRDHAYYLEDAYGALEQINGVTRTCGIIDKSVFLIPWSAKVMGAKLLRTMPHEEDIEGKYVKSILWAEFEDLVHAAKSAHKDILEDAADVGAEAHAWIEKSIRHAIAFTGGIVEKLVEERPSDKRAVKCGEAALDWMQSHHVIWLSTERVVYSKKYKYAGTMDGKAIVDGILSIIDWKSSGSLRSEYCLQTAAYLKSDVEENGVNIPDRWILRLGKEKGEFEPWHLGPETIEDDFEAFRLCLTLRRQIRIIEERMKTDKKERKPKSARKS